jgi:hypothetical protein
MIMGSSWSSGSNGSHSSELDEDDSDASMLMLPTELDAAVRSPIPVAGHVECMPMLGESTLMELELERPLRDGIIMPFCVIVGEESGDDWSARVEWCRCVQARENSAPRERRGSEGAGVA